MKKEFVILPALAMVLAFAIYIVLSEKPVAKKHQEPALPYPYYSEDVKFENKQAGITLSGTLTLPKKEGKFPVVVLITGSGPQDRNEQVFGHKPFLIIADHLTRLGIGVLRYDDRGFGKSTGNFMAATSLDFVTDAESAVAYLKTRKEVDLKKIGVAGHSEGALVAAITASRSKDIGFAISLAGPGVIGYEAINLQAELIARAGGVSEEEITVIKKTNREMTEVIRNAADTTALRASLTAFAKAHLQNYPEEMIPPGQTREVFFKNQINLMCTPWYQFLYDVNPAAYFAKITCPVLALNGAKDLQIDARQNLPAILKAVKDGGNANVTVKELPDLNHFFQHSETGHPREYADIAETFSPVALDAMSDWILAQVE